MKMLVLVLLAAVCAFLLLSWLMIDWPEEESGRYPGGVVLRDAAGRVLRVSLGPGDVDCRPYYVASPDDWIVKALVASEDRSFWTHAGARPLSILRAAFQNIVYRRRVSGASTISMQAVRLIRPHAKTYWWKWKEIVAAFKMERARSKTWIVTQYLNRAPFGSNLVGIESAAQGWFGKSAKEIGIGEAAMLAGMLQAPTRFRPDRGYGKALKRRNYVLARMRALGYITDAQLAGAKSVRPVVRRAPRPFAAPHFCDWYLAGLESGGAPSGDFTTTLDADIQEMCESAVASAAAKGRCSAAAVVLRVDSSAILGMACGDGCLDAKGAQVNTAVAPRPAGSTLKPFLAALAIERGFATPETRLKDVPMACRGYRPANFDGAFRGDVTLRDALVLSLNLPFVRLLDEVGVDAFGDTLRTLGFEHALEDAGGLGLGMAIGNVEVSLLELVRAYAVLARGGDSCFSPATTYLVSDMLSGDERAQASLGHIADVVFPRFAWKTGTSSAYRDAWTIAWNPKYVVGVWCGHKSGGFGDKTLVGAKIAAPAAWGIARQLHPEGEGPWFTEPEGVLHRRVCAETGLPATEDCPATEEGRAVAGRSPPGLCLRHRRLPDGRLAAREGDALVLLKPEDGAEFRLVPGSLDQRIVCQAAPRASGGRLWWFVDGAMAGTSLPREPFAVDMTPGEHVVACATSTGESAAAAVSVRADSASR